MKFIVTGACGFIGFHLSKKLLNLGHSVVGIDNMNDYYDVSLKEARLIQLTASSDFKYYKSDIYDKDALFEIFNSETPTQVIHLAAQAGVRYSLENPHIYADTNLVGFVNILEACRKFNVKHLVFASSSSVYGANKKTPFSVGDAVDRPISLYAATKRANELMAYTYSHLYRIPCTGLRFFTVYGEWGRPDMAYFKFTKSIIDGNPINVYNFGSMKRDFTYVDDIVKGIVLVSYNTPCDDASDPTPYKLYNIGNNNPIELSYFINTLEKVIGKKAVIEYLPMQDGDVLETYADIDDFTNATGFIPTTEIEDGLEKFVGWYRSFYNV